MQPAFCSVLSNTWTGQPNGCQCLGSGMTADLVNTSTGDLSRKVVGDSLHVSQASPIAQGQGWLLTASAQQELACNHTVRVNSCNSLILLSAAPCQPKTARNPQPTREIPTPPLIACQRTNQITTKSCGLKTPWNQPHEREMAGSHHWTS